MGHVEGMKIRDIYARLYVKCTDIMIFRYLKNKHVNNTHTQNKLALLLGEAQLYLPSIYPIVTLR